jgi:hypothetical protein
MIPTKNPAIPKKGITLSVPGLIANDWHKLKRLLAGIIPICACLKATKEPAATPTHVKPSKQRTIRTQGIIANPTKAPIPPSFSVLSNGSQSMPSIDYCSPPKVSANCSTLRSCAAAWIFEVVFANHSVLISFVASCAAAWIFEVVFANHSVLISFVTS